MNRQTSRATSNRQAIMTAMRDILPALLCLLALAMQPVHAREMGEPDLSSDEFVKRFTASYGILSEKEPELNDNEIVLLKKLAPMMRVHKESAQTLLESLTVTEVKSSPTFNYLLGNIYFENEEYFLAEEQYKEAIEGFPDFQRAWTNLGVLKLRSGDTRSALRSFLRAVELGDTKPETFGMLGYCHFKEGNYISAEVAYDRAMLSQPDNLDWLEGKAQTYLEAERYLEAIRLQDELISRRPRSAEYWMAQTNAYLALDDLPRAARNLEILRSLGVSGFQNLYLLGSLYAKLKMYGPASEAYLAAAQSLEKVDMGFLVSATEVLYQSSQYDSARQLFQRIDPSQLSPERQISARYKRLAASFAQLDGQLEQALAHLRDAEALDPLDGRTLIELAKVYNELGQRDKAYLVLDRAEHDSETEYNALLLRIKFLVQEERFDECRAYAARALEIRSSEEIQNLYRQMEQATRNSS